MFIIINLLSYRDASPSEKGELERLNIDLSNFNTNNVTDMSYMFCGCSSLINIDLSNFNTQNVIDMNFMLSDCNSLMNIILKIMS